MAVTIYQTPEGWSASSNPLSYSFSSNQVGQANFSFIVQVFFEGSLVSTEKVFIEAGNYAHFDIQEAIEPLVGYPSINESLLSDSGTSGEIYIKVFENYGTPPTNQASATSATTKVFKASITARQFEETDFDADWKLQKWLTDHPTKEINVIRNQVYIASMIGGGTSEQITISLYEPDGTLIDTHSENQSYEVWQVNIKRSHLQTVFTSDQIDDTGYMTIQIDSSELLTINYMDDYCNNPYSLLWTNKYGSFDTFIFGHADNRKGNITDTRTFKQHYGYWDGGSYIYDSTVGGEIDYAKIQKLSGQLVTLYLTQQIQNWLVSLYNSTQYLLYDVDGEVRAIRVTNKSFEFKDERFEDLINEVVEYTENTSTQSLQR